VKEIEFRHLLDSNYSAEKHIKIESITNYQTEDTNKNKYQDSVVIVGSMADNLIPYGTSIKKKSKGIVLKVNLGRTGGVIDVQSIIIEDQSVIYDVKLSD
jgi:hypothetical protein